jgi:hypothetical protein
MRTLMIALALALTVSPAAASDETDVMAAVNRFNDSLNKGDAKTALSVCATPSSIIDEFPPYAWQSATACADWASAFEAYNKANGIADSIATFGKPRHVDITDDHAYVVLPATYTYKEHGKKVEEAGSTMTAALQKTPGGWLITNWAWSKH